MWKKCYFQVANGKICDLRLIFDPRRPEQQVDALRVHTVVASYLAEPPRALRMTEACDSRASTEKFMA